MRKFSIVSTVLSVIMMALVVAMHVTDAYVGADGDWWLVVGEDVSRALHLAVGGLALPLFFVQAAFWFGHECLRNGVGSALVRRARSLIVPYFVLNLMWAPVMFWRAGSCSDWMRICGLTWNWPGVVPLWFLRDLFLILLVIGLVMMVAWWIKGKVVGEDRTGLSCALLNRRVGDNAPYRLGGESDNSNTRTFQNSSTRIVRHYLFIVFCLHFQIHVILRQVLGKDVSWPLMMVLVVMGALALGAGLKKFLPRVASVIFGGR